MVTITNKNSEKLRKKILESEKERFYENFRDIYPSQVAVKDVKKFEHMLWAHIHSKVLNYYAAQKTSMDSMQVVLSSISLQKAQSKVEDIFYHTLLKAKIQFKFQYPVGPYTADFIVKEFLNVEIDGPSHEEAKQKENDQRRDKYFHDMGYEVLRVPTWLLALDENAVVKEIRDLVKDRGF